MAQKPFGQANPARKQAMSLDVTSGRSSKVRVQPRGARSLDGGTSPRGQAGHESGRGSKVPSSIESELRAVTVVASQVNMAVKDLRSSFKTDDADFENMKSTASEVLQYLQVNELEVDSAKEYMAIIKEKNYKIEPSLKKRPAFEHIDIYAKKGVKFDTTVPSMKQKIKETVDEHLVKYCKSFHEEPHAMDVKSVKDYEDRIKKYKEALKTKQDTLDQHWTEYQQMKCPFIEGYLNEGIAINKKMEDTCVCMVDLAETMRRWTHQDRMYPARLWEEIISGNNQRHKMSENIKGVDRKKESLAHSIRKKEAVRDRIHQKLDIQKRERRKVLASKEVVEDQLEKAKKEQTQNKEQLKENELMINQRKSNSPKFLDMLWTKSERLKEEEQRIEERIEAYKRQLSRFDSTEEELSSKVKELEGELAEENYEIKEMKDKMEALNREKSRIQHDMEEKEAKIKTAKRIRDLKLNPTTIRKIYYQRWETQTVQQDDLSEACRLVSRKIGNNWPVLYQNLPFMPPRDSMKKSHDIETVYVTCLHRDQTLSEQAWQSLLKWRIFNRQKKTHRNMAQLVKALRKVEKNSLAKTIESKYLKAQSI